MEQALAPGEHTAAVEGTTLRYQVAGTGPVLIVQSPGWGIGAAPYTATFGRLEASFTVVYLHPRGSRGADPEPASKLHVGQFVEDLEAFRRWLGLERFALAGHSHGGLIATHYALRYPARLHCLVLLDAQLVGVAGHPGEQDAAVDPAKDGAIAAAYEYLASVGGFARLSTLRSDAEATEFLEGITPLYFRATRHAGSLRAALAGAALPLHTLRSVSGTDGAFALEPAALRACPVPTLAVSGRYDIFCPPSTARQLTETMPRATLAVFEESGHFPWVEEPETFFPTVKDFVTTHTS
jgi:proline iminopeptidase